jgi:hypothetical protein
LWAEHDGVLDPELIFFTVEAGSIGVDISVLKTVGIGAVLIQGRLLKCPF